MGGLPRLRQELDLDERAAGDPVVQLVLAVQSPEDRHEHGPALVRLGDRQPQSAGVWTASFRSNPWRKAIDSDAR